MLTLFLICFLQSIELVPGSDATAAIQAEIDRVEAVGHGTVRLPQGTFKVSDTLHLGHGDKFTSISLIGAAEGIPYGTRFGTTLEATFSDRPIVNVQGGRGNKIKGIQFLGTNSAIQFEATPSQDVATYSRFYPQYANQQFCGISIDAFSGQPPTEPRYRGLFAKRHTSMVTVENCQFRFLGCGIVTKPSGGSGADAQGDYLLVSDCNFQYCQWGASINGSQTRQNTFRDCKFWDLYCAVGMGQHGIGLCGNALVSGGSMDRVGYGILGRKVGFANGITIENTVGEQIGTILDVQEGHGVCQVTIDKVRLALDNDTHFKFKPYHIRSDQCVTRISNSIFRTWGTSVRPVFTVLASEWIMLDGNTVRRANTDTKNSPNILVFPTHPSTEVADGSNYRFLYKPERLSRQTRIIAGAVEVLPRVFKGEKTLDCKVGDVYACAMLSEVDPILFRVNEVTARELTIEILNCGSTVQDAAKISNRLQQWANFVWRLP